MNDLDTLLILAVVMVVFAEAERRTNKVQPLQVSYRRFEWRLDYLTDNDVVEMFRCVFGGSVVVIRVVLRLYCCCLVIQAYVIHRHEIVELAYLLDVA